MKNRIRIMYIVILIALLLSIGKLFIVVSDLKIELSKHKVLEMVDTYTYGGDALTIGYNATNGSYTLFSEMLGAVIYSSVYLQDVLVVIEDVSICNVYKNCNNLRDQQYISCGSSLYNEAIKKSSDFWLKKSEG